MAQMFILCGCIALMGIGFYTAAKSGAKKKAAENRKKIPEELQQAFKTYMFELMAEKGILLISAKIINMDKIEEIPDKDGKFIFCNLEIMLEPADPESDDQGLNVNTKELLNKVGINDDFVVLFFKEEVENQEPQYYEISFIPAQRAKLQGYKPYVERRYKNIAEKYPIRNYGVFLSGSDINLWQNIAEDSLFELTKTRKKAEDELAYNAQYIDIYENEDVEIKVLIQFERKKEMIYSIRCKTYKAETPAGIRVGSTVEQLKEAYGNELAYLEDYLCEGPAYGYIPDDDTKRYIAFKVENKIVTEMIVTDGMEGRVFVPKEGYIDQDIPWIEVDYSEKFTDKYARELYIGQHKFDVESRQVFNTFVANNFELGSILEKGLWKEYAGGTQCKYYLICEGSTIGKKAYVEVMLLQLDIDGFAGKVQVWAVSKYRVQERKG